MTNAFKQIKIYRKFVIWLNQKFPVFFAKMRYRHLFGKSLRLNPPVDLNEKILWLSLYSDTTEWSRLADKYAVREYIEECGYGDALVQLYGKWDKFDDINWNDLPDAFVLKTNHGSGSVWVINKKNDVDKDKIKKDLNNSLSHLYGLSTSEKHYSRIKPCIIAEQVLIPSQEDLNNSSSLIDYKIWCFNGRAEFIWVVSNRTPMGFDGTMFNRNWTPVPNVVHPNVDYVHTPSKMIERPALLDEMLSMAERLSMPFPEVRVDLYYVSGKIYFGELTFTTHGGTIDYMTDEQLLKMGQMIDLTGIKKIR